eukprot:1861208-Rhodomonas_salina.3
MEMMEMMEMMMTTTMMAKQPYETSAKGMTLALQTTSAESGADLSGTSLTHPSIDPDLIRNSRLASAKPPHHNQTLHVQTEQDSTLPGALPR